MRSMLVIGAGHFGQNLAVQLEELGNEVMLVDSDEEVVDRLAGRVTSAQIGDCMDIEVLRALGVGNFDVCFVCIGENFQASLEIASLLKELGAKRVVAKSDDDLHARLLLKIGADEVVYPERDMARRTAARFSARGAFEMLELSPEYAISELAAPTAWVGQTVGSLGVRARYGINIIGTRGGADGKIAPLTSAEHQFAEGERLIVAGALKDIIAVANRN